MKRFKLFKKVKKWGQMFTSQKFRWIRAKIDPLNKSIINHLKSVELLLIKTSKTKAFIICQKLKDQVLSKALENSISDQRVWFKRVLKSLSSQPASLKIKKESK